MKPTEDAEPPGRRIVAPSRVAGRREPDQRSELTTEWLFGEMLRVVEADDPWLRVRGPDGYRSWVHRGGLWQGPASAVAAWEEAATARSLGVRLRPGTPGASVDAPGAVRGPAREPDGRPRCPRFLPWGARLAPDGNGRTRLPGGGRARYTAPDGVVAGPERAERFPPDGEAVAETALGWRGVPYLWGGRTREGADCSGFVQAVLALHGVDLPRDSGDQLDVGPPVPADAGLPAPPGPGPGVTEAEGEADRAAGRPGDLLFFGDGLGDVTHVALVVEGPRVVHAAAENGSVAVDDLSGDAPLERRLRRRLVGATRPLAEG